MLPGPQDFSVTSPGSGVLTHGIKGRQQADIHPSLWGGRHQLDLQSARCVLLRKRKAQPRDWVLPLRCQLCPNLLDDLPSVALLVLEVREAVEEEDELSIAVTPEVRAPAEGATLRREEQLGPGAYQPQPRNGSLADGGSWGTSTGPDPMSP